MTHVGITYSTRYGEATILAFHPDTHGVLLRMGGRHVLVALSDFTRWNPQPIPQAV